VVVLGFVPHPNLQTNRLLRGAVMDADLDVIIVGSGPAGVSAAFPLVQAGLRVLMVDGGKHGRSPPIAVPYLQAREHDLTEGLGHQWQWMLGHDHYALRHLAALSPKMRIPQHAYIFEDFEQVDKIQAIGFFAIGSLAQGGLSNAWGCGVARLSHQELIEYPFAPSELDPSYAVVTRRMGVSGATPDDLSDYFGLDDWADPPIPIDALQGRLIDRYLRKRSLPAVSGIRLGRARVAALSIDRDERLACDLSGNCLWGCHRRSLYSATEDIEALKRYDNFIYRSGFVVDRVTRTQDQPSIQGGVGKSCETLAARKVILAAGTLATTRLALLATGIERPVALLSSPVAAFMLWVPAALGTPRRSAFGLGQLAFTTNPTGEIPGYGSLFNTTGIPIAEFARFMPLHKRAGIDILKSLLSSCVVGNFYLPGRYTRTRLKLRADDWLLVEGAHEECVPALMQTARQRLGKAFLRLGALMLPGSFTLAKPGGDVHYAGSLPMRATPIQGETDASGQLYGLNDVHIVDGASLSALTEKPHTLTIMANADRIGRRLAAELVPR
jgi:choline dehydrogenase-like flavoprotein